MLNRTRVVWDSILSLLSGKKTYLVALCGVVYGLYVQDKEVVILSLGLIGLRDGVKSEAEKVLDVLLKKKK